MKSLRLSGLSATNDYAAEVTAAVDAVRVAAALCLQVQPHAGALKKDRSPVTVADFGSQAVVCKILQERFPEDTVMAEEEAGELQRRSRLLEAVVGHVRNVYPEVDRESVLEWIAVGAGRPTAERYWVLDPVDGTKGFLAGRSYAVALALVMDGAVVVGALACPVSGSPDGGKLFAALRNQGAVVGTVYGDDVMTQVQVSGVADPREAVLCESFEAQHTSRAVSERVARRLGIVGNTLRMDSQAKYGAIASGKADIYLRFPAKVGHVEWAWDHAAGVLVLEEAGGTVTDVQGRRLDFAQGGRLVNNQGVVATNGVLQEAVLAAVQH